MSAVPDTRMTVDDYLAWAQGRPGRYELHDGLVYTMSAERAVHAEIKGAIYAAFRAQIRDKCVGCFAMPDGMAVRVDAATVYEPDALVYCGPKLPPGALLVPEPVVIVEVLSDSTRRFVEGPKLVGYFMLPSVQHYLIVDPDQSLVVHHARTGKDTLATRIVRSGAVALDPPGLLLTFDEIYAG